MPKPIREPIQSKIILIGLALLGFILLLFREQWLLFIGDFLVIKDDLHPADVIHVIAGDEYRLDYAIQLYQQGYGKKIFLTGGGWCPQHNVVHESGWKARAIEQGVPTENIIIDDSKITSTYSEVERLKEWIENNPTPIHSLIVVSDPFHMRRTCWTCKRVLGEGIEVQMAPAPFEQTPYLEKWWEDPKSNSYVKDEYQKFIYYIARYQLSWGPIKDWLASLDTE